MTATTARKLARFELLRELGRGAQASVWLAHDPRLDREVALKLLDPGADPLSVGPWLDEARAVSRLAHPNVVPLFEADVFDGQPCLVFEFVDGPTLAQLRRTRPAWPAREAVTLMLGVLEALAAAHAQGIVHRDLKPSNILVGSDGRARVMDFGIAARVAVVGRGALAGARKSAGAGRIVGTAGYISPEAARGDAPDPVMDVFSAGVVLAELLAGAPLLRETDPLRAVQRVQTEDLELPAGLAIDEALHGIVQRALARDAAQRYDTAASMRAALAAWLKPGDMTTTAAPQHGTLDFLLRRMRHKTDFPALSDSVARIQRVAASDSESLASMSSEILKDVALTNKLLRMVNTVHFAQGAGGGVGTVSRAVALIGFAGVRNLALSVLLLEHMSDKGHAAQLKDEFVRALMAGTLASELLPQAGDAEDAFLASMFQNLGRLLTEYYFPEEALQIRLLLPPGHASPAEREGAARQVLGLGFEDLGLGIARAWGLPEGLQRAMRSPDGDAAGRAPAGSADRLRWLGRGANALTDALLAEPGSTEAQVAEVAELYAPVLGLPARQMTDAVQQARAKLVRLTQAMGLHLAPGSASRRLLEAPRMASPVRAVAQGLGRSDSAAGAALAQGLEDLARDVGRSPLRLVEVLRRVIETMHRALDFRCVLFCLRDPKSGLITGRFGVGVNADAACQAFRVALGPAAQAGPAGGDLFAALCSRGADMLIADAGAANVAGRLPDWYRQAVDARTFLLLPLMLKGAPVGLIYADKAEAGSIVLADRELAMLRALRDQAVGAFARSASA